MEWQTWLLVAVLLGALYFLGLTGYRIFLATKKLSSEIARSERMISELTSVETPPIPIVRPNTGDQYLELLANREQLKSSRRKQAEARKRKLIERISSIEVDKR